MTVDQLVALLQEIADLRIRAGRAEAEVLVLRARVAELEAPPFVDTAPPPPS